ncbi:uncharacterized protein LOC111673865, partial [Orussus abietinus]|uniref:uncharacterized protein LOC111673865 n=1 Tax=Orussus abietinus TaxID=222816 RepID=UPI000C715E81
MEVATGILAVFVVVVAAAAQNVSFDGTDAAQSYDPQFMVGCYFPAEFQGEFVMQVSGMGARGSRDMGEPIQYSSVNITFNSIPVWGYCHKRVGGNVLLMD